MIQCNELFPNCVYAFFTKKKHSDSALISYIITTALQILLASYTVVWNGSHSESD